MRIAAVGFAAAAAIAASPAAGSTVLQGFVVFASNRAPDLEPQIFTVAANGGPRRNVSHSWLHSNISPAVSPDGKRLAYDSDGTIYVSRVDGSRRRRLGRGAEPAWSPDGSRIAFGGFRGLTVVRADGSRARVLVPETVFSPSWSRDGRMLAYYVTDVGPDDDQALEIVGADGAGRRRLTGPLRDASTPSWSSGRELVLAAAQFTVTGDTVTGDVPGLHVFDADTGAERSLAVDGSDPRWSPDGRWIAFAGDDGIDLVHPDGTGLRRLTRSFRDEQPAWSPDGRRLAFFRASRDIEVIGRDGGRLRRVWHGGPHDDLLETGGPAWAHGGRTIVFGSEVEANDEDIYRMRADGTGIRRLTTSSAAEGEPRWSPDAQRIAFVRGGDLYTMSRDGTDFRRLRACGRPGCSSPAWSPDGTRILFTDGPRLELVGADGRGLRRLARGVAADWSWRTDLIAYLHGGDVVVGLPGRRPRVVYRIQASADASAPTGPAWSPDGKRLALVAYTSDGRYDEAYVAVVTLRPRRRVREIQLPDEIGQSRPAWSPDGRALLLSLGSGNLAVVRLDGHIVRYTTRGPALDTDPDWR